MLHRLYLLTGKITLSHIQNDNNKHFTKPTKVWNPCTISLKWNQVSLVLEMVSINNCCRYFHAIHIISFFHFSYEFAGNCLFARIGRRNMRRGGSYFEFRVTGTHLQAMQHWNQVLVGVLSKQYFSGPSISLHSTYIYFILYQIIQINPIIVIHFGEECLRFS